MTPHARWVCTEWTFIASYPFLPIYKFKRKLLCHFFFPARYTNASMLTLHWHFQCQWLRKPEPYFKRRRSYNQKQIFNTLLPTVGVLSQLFITDPPKKNYQPFLTLSVPMISQGPQHGVHHSMYSHCITFIRPFVHPRWNKARRITRSCYRPLIETSITTSTSPTYRSVFFHHEQEFRSYSVDHIPPKKY